MTVRNVRSLRFATVLLVNLKTVRAYCAVKPEHEKLVKDVSTRLLAVATSPKDYEWPPLFLVIDKEEVNAFAVSLPPKDKTKRVPGIGITGAMMEKVVNGDADLLAMLLAHELSHVLLGHTVPDLPGATPQFVLATHTREQELQADTKGMELALAAGYSFQRAIKGIRRFIDLGFEYSSFDSLSVDHPSWKERLAHLEKDQSSLWRAMSAFETGTVFLTIEQYAAADRCFRAVTKDFPDCYEGWANLGHALLMQYCDALEVEDLRRFGIGQIVCGGFYRRPASLEARVRGVDEELWWDAVGALREGLRLKPDLTLAKVNLGIAYLVRPAGKDTGQATRYLQEALDDPLSSTTLDPIVLAGVQINLAVADFAVGQTEQCALQLSKAREAVLPKLKAKDTHPYTLDTAMSLIYNDAFLRSSSKQIADRQSAAKGLQIYLELATPSSTWWVLGYERYVTLCEELGIASKSRAALQKATPRFWRPVVSAEVNGKTVALTEEVPHVIDRLGEGQSVPAVAGTNLLRIRYPQYGCDILANGAVVAISLAGENAPRLTIRGFGAGAKPSTLRIGMSLQELAQILGNEPWDFRDIADPAEFYRFYRNLGLAVKVRNAAVTEIVVVQIPAQKRQGGG